MKVLKTLLYILIALILVLVLLGFAGPKTFDVSRSTEIDAPKAIVFNYLKSLKRQNDWGPWKEEDPDMEVSYEGEDGTVGFASEWKSDKVGSGKQTIKSIEGTTIETDLVFYMPWGESNSTGYMNASDAGKGTEVTWGIRGENDFISRILGVFMNMEKAISPMFDKGLANLKALIEEDLNKEYNGYKVNLVQWPGMDFAAIRSTISMNDVESFFDTNMPKLAGVVSSSSVQMTGAPCGLYYTWDEENMSTDLAAAVPVASKVTGPDVQSISIAAGPGLRIDSYGNYDKLGNVHVALDEFMKATGVSVRTPVIEEYVTDPMTEQDTAKWLTKVYYLLDQ